jgi:short-subunit dehydrogenase
MVRLISRVLDAWHRRWWSPHPQVRAAAERGNPAAVVTGASEGIGLEFARQLAGTGITVVAIARTEPTLRAICVDIVAKSPPGTRVLPLPLDLAHPEAVDRLDEFLTLNALHADILVNNAGVGVAGPFTSKSEPELTALIDLNIRALTLLTRRLLPGMLARGRGGIINVASLGGYVPGPYQAAYYASKAYVMSLTEALAEEVAGKGVRVLAVAPGPVQTNFHATMGADHALYRWLVPAAQPQMIARRALSDGARRGRSPGP